MAKTCRAIRKSWRAFALLAILIITAVQLLVALVFYFRPSSPTDDIIYDKKVIAAIEQKRLSSPPASNVAWAIPTGSWDTYLTPVHFLYLITRVCSGGLTNRAVSIDNIIKTLVGL